MSLPLLIITDGTTTVDLLSRTGYHLSDWRPAIATFKNDGIRRSSVISEGSRLVGYQYDNVIETFTLDMDERSQDGAARQLQVLHRLLVKGVDYWARGGVNEPVWIEARSGDEQYTRYATVMNYKMDSIGNPYGMEFLGSGDKLGMAELVLTIERGHWMEHSPTLAGVVQAHSYEIAPVTAQVFGRTDWGSTSTPYELFASSKQVLGNLTHIFVYDPVIGYGPNLIGTAFDWQLFEPPIISNSALYFIEQLHTGGSWDGGPFNSLVFDIAIAAMYTAPAHMHWEYYDSVLAGWHNIDFDPAVQTLYDRTAFLPENPFSKSGVHTVHWHQPNTATHKWAPTAVNGITGWAVRCRADVPGGQILFPTQQHRNIYTVNLPYVEIDANDVRGDVDALAQLTLSVVSEPWGAPSVYVRAADRLMVGLRSVDRDISSDEAFTAYLNLTDHKRSPAYMTIDVDASVTGCTAFADAAESSTGRAIIYTSAGGGAWPPALEVIVHIMRPVVTNYYGTYRAFLRMKQTAGMAQTCVQLKGLIEVTPGAPVVNTYPVLWESDPVFVTGSMLMSTLWDVVDFGAITIPATLVPDREAGSEFLLGIYIYCSGIANVVTLYDLVLIPVDEWSADIVIPFDAYVNNYYWGDDTYLQVSSAKMPRPLISARTVNGINGVELNMKVVANGRIVMHPNRAQRFWFLPFSSYSVASLIPGSRNDFVIAVLAEKNSRYLTLRGSE